MTEQPVTQRQLRFIQALARELEMDQAQLNDLSAQHYDMPADRLSRHVACELIDMLIMQHEEKRP